MPDMTPDTVLSALELPVWDRRTPSPFRRVVRLAGDIGTLLVVAAAAIAAVTWFGTLLGVQLSGPSHANAAVATQVTALAPRVTKLERGELQLQGALRIQGFMLCLQTRSRERMVVAYCSEVARQLQPEPLP